MESQSHPNVATNLANLRKALKISQTELAFLISTSVSQYGPLEKGKAPFNAPLINSLTKACGITWRSFQAEPRLFTEQSLQSASVNLSARMRLHRDLLSMDVDQVLGITRDREESDVIVPSFHTTAGDFPVAVSDLIEADIRKERKPESPELSVMVENNPRRLALSKDGQTVQLTFKDHVLVKHAIDFIAWE